MSSKISKKPREKTLKTFGLLPDNHQKYISRITKTLYYSKLPKTDRLSLPATEFACKLFSESHRGHSLSRLYCDEASEISRNACVSPCSLVLAVLYLERLKIINPEYLEKTTPSDLFLVSLMVSCKFLQDDGEIDEVFLKKWAKSGKMSPKELIQMERDFLNAIDWKVYVKDAVFWEKLTEIETKLAAKQGLARGFFTYTEMQNLSKILDLHNIIQNIVTLSSIVLASYLIAFFSIAGTIHITQNSTTKLLRVPEPKIFTNDNIILALNRNVENHVTTIDNSERLNNIDSELYSGEMKAMTVLKTGYFLASIEGLLKPFCGQIKPNQTANSIDTPSSKCELNAEDHSWDWWNIPALNWLTKISSQIEIFEIPPLNLGDSYFANIYANNLKQSNFEAHVHWATKTRIQDQMENTWHAEWTDILGKKL